MAEPNSVVIAESTRKLVASPLLSVLLRARSAAYTPRTAGGCSGARLGAAASLNEASAASGYAAFAQAYPKKTGMGAARAAFTEACSPAEPNYIVARAALYAQDFQGSRAQYAIAPAKWLAHRDASVAQIKTVFETEVATSQRQLAEARAEHTGNDTRG